MAQEAVLRSRDNETHLSWRDVTARHGTELHNEILLQDFTAVGSLS